jgi:hypothetical protein
MCTDSVATDSDLVFGSSSSDTDAPKEVVVACLTKRTDAQRDDAIKGTTTTVEARSSIVIRVRARGHRETIHHGIQVSIRDDAHE